MPLAYPPDVEALFLWGAERRAPTAGGVGFRRSRRFPPSPSTGASGPRQDLRDGIKLVE